MKDDLERLRTRNRLLDLRKELENRAHGSLGRSIPSQVLLGQVIDGGAIPTESGRYFLVNPGRAGGSPTEGDAFTTQWDTSRRIPVLVIGKRVPKEGDILQAWSVSSGRWVAESNGGPPPPCLAGRICVTVQATGCAIPLTGVTVTITDDDSPPNVIDAPVTVGVIDSITIGSSGSGYTNGTGYALGISGNGTGATGTFDVVGGHVTNIVITNPGTGYSTATITFPGAGGSGATATATIKGRACTALPSAGTYHVTAHIPGATDVTTTVNAVCGVDNNVTLTYPTGSVGRACFAFTQCGYPLGKQPYPGVIATISGATATSATDGTCCIVLGVGSYSATVSYPQGATETLFVGAITSCATKNIASNVQYSCRYNASCNFNTGSACSASIRIYDSVSGSDYGTGTLALVPDIFTPHIEYKGEIDIVFSPEITDAKIMSAKIDVIWPNAAYNRIGGTNPVSCLPPVIPIGVYSGTAPCT